VVVPHESVMVKRHVSSKLEALESFQPKPWYSKPTLGCDIVFETVIVVGMRSSLLQEKCTRLTAATDGTATEIPLSENNGGHS